MTGKRIVFPALIGLAVAAAAIWFLAARGPAETTFALLSDADIAARATAPDPEDLTRSLDVTKTEGPLIRVAAPNGAALASPVNFDIQIEPNGGIPVDMSSIRIEYKIGPAWVNVTRTIMKYASIEGSRLYAKGAELPTGNHLLRVSVSDDKARKTRATVRFKISK
ncbi:MAG: hypothetical protein ACWA5A_11005 [Marinibacterium sp.]